MQIPAPTPDDLARLADAHGIILTGEERDAATAVLPVMVATIAALCDADAAPPAPSGRVVGARPAPDDDPHNAIVRRCTVRGRGDGPLTGMRLGIKDNVSIAGVPLTAGSRLLGEYVPARDATIVRRLLDAGAEIVATLNMDDLALSARGDTSVHGPVRNPHDRTRLAGGSSGGSAAALFYDGIDATIGGDQGGSIRVPASWCGVVGLKPTHGLVPYTGIVAIDPTIDHVGPMARTVSDVARVLEVIAGHDPDDPRQRAAAAATVRYTRALDEGVRGLRVGVLAEGFGGPGSEPEVDAAVRDALRRLAAHGAEVREVSVPQHALGSAALLAIILEGMRGWLLADGVGRHLDGWYDRGLAAALRAGMRERPDALPPTAKLALVGGGYLAQHLPGGGYAAAQNLRPAIRAAYDRVLGDVDVLAMPTTPMRAMPVEPRPSLTEVFARGLEIVTNTGPFDVTGHPSVSVPCAAPAGLPIGLMLVGRRFEDATVLRAAAAFERARG